MARPPSPYFERLISSLVMAAPFTLAARWKHPAHCIEMSLAAVAALEKRKVRARLLPCAIVGQTLDRSRGVSVGLNREEIYANAKNAHPDIEPFAAWCARYVQHAPDGVAAHAVVEATFHGSRALVDLAFAQLRVDHGIPCPPAHAHYGESWPDVQIGGWNVRYVESPHARDVQALAKTCTNYGGVAGDLLATMDAAMAVGLDIDRFLAALRGGDPGVFAQSMNRLAAWGDGRPQ